jgi:ribosomal protein L29
MSEVEELKEQVALLRAEVLALRQQIGTTGMRLGPRQETSDEIKARTDKLASILADVKTQPLPVDRTALCTTNGKTPEEVRAAQTNETGQHDGYIVLCDTERAKGFVRPYRDRYQHTPCGGVTTMGRALSETYARDPNFYSHTFCCNCNRHLPVAEFVWSKDGQVVGS